MLDADNRNRLTQFLMLAIENEHKRANVLAIQYANEEMRADLLAREQELVEQSAAHVARTSEAQKELRVARRTPQTTVQQKRLTPTDVLDIIALDPDLAAALISSSPETQERQNHLRHRKASDCKEFGADCPGMAYWKPYDFDPIPH